MVKIIATISNFGAALHIGGGVEKNSYTIEVPTRNVPEKIREYLEDDTQRVHSTISLSILQED